ncbi:MAG TPA: carbohydrate-binding protein [Polyangia bacterium]|nr:carbohydrate-binding protein [Polyangia bacterium]
MRDRLFVSGALPLALAVAGLSACGQPTEVVGSALTASTATTIWIDAAAQTANPHFWANSVGTGTASLALRGDLESHYKIGNREAGFQRVRGHGVLSDDMGIYKAPGVYEWTNLDRYLTAIAAAGMRPIMEMDFMPKALALHGDKHDIYKNAADYRSFIAAVVRHCVERFGMADVSQWYWEIWNEPDYAAFWHGSERRQSTARRMKEYETLYDNAVAAITSVIPDALVGGPAATNPAPIGQFLQHCKAAGTRVTFVSSHHYPGGDGSGPAADASDLVADNLRRIEAITGAGYSTSDVLSFNTEWNSSYFGQGGGTGDGLVSMDNHWNVGFILKAAKLMADAGTANGPPLSVFSYWVLSDVFDESSGPSGSYILGQDGGNLPFGSVFGLMTAQGVRKADFNAFKMLNRLGPIRLRATGGASSEGVDAMATLSQAGDQIQILVYDQYTKLDTSGTDTVTVNLYNLPPALAGKPVFVTRFIVDETHSNPYSVWQGQGSPPNPSEAQWREMRAAQHLYALPAERTTLAGSFSTTIDVNRQSGTLLVLSLSRPVMGRDATAPIEAEDYDGQWQASRRDGGDADLGQVAAVAAGGELFYDVVDFSDAGVDSLQLRVQASHSTQVEVHLDAADGPSIGVCPVGGGAGWTTVSCALAHTSGVHNVHLTFAGAATLNWLQFH